MKNKKQFKDEEWFTLENPEGNPKCDVLATELYYPMSEGNAHAIHIDLCDVRSSDGIRVEYDFERDGWVIMQTKCWQIAKDMMQDDGDWKEVAFVQTRGREVEKEEDEK